MKPILCVTLTESQSAMPAILLDGKEDALRSGSVQDGRGVRDYLPGATGLLVSRRHQRRSLENISDAIRLYLDYLSDETESRKERLIQEGKDEGLPVELHKVDIADPAVV